MLDSLNAIVEFFSMLLTSFKEVISYMPDAIEFFLYSTVPLLSFTNGLLPPYMMFFAYVTIMLTVVLAIVGRSNNRG